MPLINYASRVINLKIVYYGPGLCGKTTNLQYIFDKTDQQRKGSLVSLATEADRTLFFDFLPIEVAQINGFQTKLHLYTVPGQVFYNASRKLILKEVDGIVFVADLQAARFEANLESMDNLIENLEEYGYDIKEIPTIIQYNKIDLPNIASIAELDKEMNPYNFPIFKASAANGQGVFETLKGIAKLVVKKLQGK
ncbi:GTPase domain-containing protein [bacterium]|nr:GTPase domain-containing protein [bacterium]